MPVSTTSVFDYIIVGAGTAGCVLAARLTESPAINVLLIEAGPPDGGGPSRTPLAFPRLFRSTRDWAYWTEPQPELEDRRLFWPRGKMLGGSASMNAMVHMDPCRADLDSWVEDGCPGWGFDDLREIFDLADAELLHAGPLPSLNPLSEAFLEACAENGLPRSPYLRDACKTGSGPFRVNIHNGQRFNARQAYLEPALSRGNLTVWTRVPVSRVLFHGERATGIEYIHGGVYRRVGVTREVILAAGAIGSPHLLMLSGIGPEAHLADHAIPVRAALEGVGANLQDHLAAPVSRFCTQPVSLSGANTRWNRVQYALRRQGPLTSNGAEAGAFFSSSSPENNHPESRSGEAASVSSSDLANNKESDQSKSSDQSKDKGKGEDSAKDSGKKAKPATEPCDLELLFAPVHYVDHGFAHPGGHGFGIIPVLIAPKSRGTVRLYSAEPWEAPLIDPRYLSSRGSTKLAEQPSPAEHDPADSADSEEAPPPPEEHTVETSPDLARLAEGVQRARTLLEHPAFAAFKGLPIQGKRQEPEEHVRTWGQTLYHPVGTCRMGVFRVAGPGYDPVVDLALQVHGVVGLRVVDASVMPRIPRAHINLTVIAIAEKAARLILEGR